MNEADRSYVIRLAATTLAVSVFSMIAVLLAGLFSPEVDNDKIFGILGPSYQTIIGCLVGLLGGMRMTPTVKGKNDE